MVAHCISLAVNGSPLAILSNTICFSDSDSMLLIPSYIPHDLSVTLSATAWPICPTPFQNPPLDNSPDLIFFSMFLRLSNLANAFSSSNVIDCASGPYAPSSHGSSDLVPLAPDNKDKNGCSLPYFCAAASLALPSRSISASTSRIVFSRAIGSASISCISSACMPSWRALFSASIRWLACAWLTQLSWT